MVGQVFERLEINVSFTVFIEQSSKFVSGFFPNVMVEKGHEIGELVNDRIANRVVRNRIGGIVMTIVRGKREQRWR